MYAPLETTFWLTTCAYTLKPPCWDTLSARNFKKRVFAGIFRALLLTAPTSGLDRTVHSSASHLLPSLPENPCRLHAPNMAHEVAWELNLGAGPVPAAQLAQSGFASQTGSPSYLQSPGDLPSFSPQPGAQADPSKAPIRRTSAGRGCHSKEPFFGDFSSKKHWNAPQRLFCGRPFVVEHGITGYSSTNSCSHGFLCKQGLNEDRTPETANLNRTDPAMPCYRTSKKPCETMEKQC